MQDMEEIIGAFVDDERVDTDALKRALALPEGRDYLVELLAMRELVAVPVASAIAQAPPARTSLRWAVAAAAAVLLTLSAAGGYVVGTRTGSVAPATVPATASSVPPAPTSVIRLKSGVDWNERSGGGN